ncbi:MAG: glucosidase [Planctomycetaceae bacterium]|nr:glucosidase [Planctomycetaceae bacterium]
MNPTQEEIRLQQSHNRTANWQRWGPYLSERQWGTIREDYSESGDAWRYFPHDHARSRAYRWGEDGLLGICDRECRLCFALALWNGRDPLLKERLFGLTGPEGNHGEDVKECYYYLDNTPTHSYMKALYKYPQSAYPYARLVAENGRRGRHEPEFELVDSGLFDEDRYFDVLAEYAKASPDDILIRITVANRGPDPAVLHLLPTLWFRNTWSWGCTHEGCEIKPRIAADGKGGVAAEHATLGQFRLLADAGPEGRPPTWLFTDNETNTERLYALRNGVHYCKDAFHEYLVRGNPSAVNPNGFGTKTAAHYRLQVPAGGEIILRLRLVFEEQVPDQLFGEVFERILSERIHEVDEFYSARLPYYVEQSAAQRHVARQAYAGLLWSKQFYHYAVRDWLAGDPEQPTPPDARRYGRNRDWPHLFNRDVISMPDKWEYPWYAAWDLAFHMVAMARVDPEFAKGQLDLFLREWYMHPNGQVPAYEWDLSDVNPPVHAWACWRVYKITGPHGRRDRQFLARTFTKLLLNFTWWVNRKDERGGHLFSGGFLGLDNIGVFDRSKPLPDGGHLEQADGTAWMASYCATMLSMALELAQEDPTYEDIASKFFEHFVGIADAMNCLGGCGLWNEADGFYYDQLMVDGRTLPLQIRSMVGIIPLFAVEVLEDEVIGRLPGFRKRLEWFLTHRSDLARYISYMQTMHDGGSHGHRLLAIPSRERLQRVLRYLLDENEFLSPYGVRALSRVYKDRPYVVRLCGQEQRVEYVPGESDSGLFGGNSNWRGPIWVPVNYLLIEALERYHHFYGDDLLVECPTGSGRMMNLQQVAREISRRLTSIFLPGTDGRRPCHGDDRRYADDPHWRDLVLFHEYFHGDDGRGVGASHQTGWTALIARLFENAPCTAWSSRVFGDELSSPRDVRGEASEPAASRQTIERGPLPALAQRG